MNSRTLVRNSGPVFLAPTCVLLLISMKAHALSAEVQEGQQQSQSQQPPPPQNSQPSSPQIALPEQTASKKHRVWTNDDVVSLRSPADTYLAEKEAQQAAHAEEAAKKLALAKQMKEAGVTLDLPSTSEETQRLIKAKQDQIRDFQDAIDRLNKDLPDALQDRKPEIQKEIETFKGYLQKAQLELSVLQDHFQDLAKTQPSETPPSPPAPSPPSPRPSTGNP